MNGMKGIFKNIYFKIGQFGLLKGLGLRLCPPLLKDQLASI